VLSELKRVLGTKFGVAQDLIDDFIREHTFADPDFGRLAVVEDGKLIEECSRQQPCLV
jgi:hypothetical protein